MQIRVLDFGYQSALRSQAVYHGVASMLTSDSEPVLTLVNPLAPYVCVGLHQDITLEVDEQYCREASLPIIRRHVGGGAVYLDHNQMFFHFIYPRRDMPTVVSEIYPKFIEPVVRTYRALGIEANYRAINDIHVNGRKIGGTGAAWIGEATVMVGSFMFDFDVDTMAHCLKVPSEKFRDKLRSGLHDYITTMRRELPQTPDRNTVKQLFLAHIADCLGVTAVHDSASELEMAAIDDQERALASPEWTYQDGRRLIGNGVKICAGTHLTESAFKAPGGLIRVRLLAKDGQIDDVQFSGDFTVFPANGVHLLAAELKNAELSKFALTAKIERTMRALGLDMPGVEPAHVAGAILSSVHRE